MNADRDELKWFYNEYVKGKMPEAEWNIPNFDSTNNSPQDSMIVLRAKIKKTLQGPVAQAFDEEIEIPTATRKISTEPSFKAPSLGSKFNIPTKIAPRVNTISPIIQPSLPQSYNPLTPPTSTDNGYTAITNTPKMVHIELLSI